MSGRVNSSQLVETLTDFTGYQPPERQEQGSRSIAEFRDTRRPLRPSTRRRQKPIVDVEESIRLAAGKPDLAEELFSMLLEQLRPDQETIRARWAAEDYEAVLECVHKLHGATRYCGVPELRDASEQFETALKRRSADMESLRQNLLAAMERLDIWGDQTDWQAMFRNSDQLNPV